MANDLTYGSGRTVGSTIAGAGGAGVRDAVGWLLRFADVALPLVRLALLGRRRRRTLASVHLLRRPSERSKIYRYRRTLSFLPYKKKGCTGGVGGRVKRFGGGASG